MLRIPYTIFTGYVAYLKPKTHEGDRLLFRLGFTRQIHVLLKSSLSPLPPRAMIRLKGDVAIMQ